MICVDAPRWRYWRVVATAGAITTIAFSINIMHNMHIAYILYRYIEFELQLAVGRAMRICSLSFHPENLSFRRTC